MRWDLTALAQIIEQATAIRAGWDREGRPLGGQFAEIRLEADVDSYLPIATIQALTGTVNARPMAPIPAECLLFTGARGTGRPHSLSLVFLYRTFSWQLIESYQGRFPELRDTADHTLYRIGDHHVLFEKLDQQANQDEEEDDL
jgi:hypothetical protein